MNISLQYPQNVKNHSLQMHVKLNANLTFLTSSYVKVLKISRGNKLVFWKLLRTYDMDDPCRRSHCNCEDIFFRWYESDGPRFV